MFLSNPTEIVNHPDYQAIIALGKRVVPLIMENFKKRDGSKQWSHALMVLTGADPIKDEHRGVIKLIMKDWEEWWEEHHSEYE